MSINPAQPSFLEPLIRAGGFITDRWFQYLSGLIRSVVAGPGAAVSVSNGVATVSVAGFSGFAAYTPTVSSSAGTITSASATGRWCQIGRLVFVEIVITITTNGTGSGDVMVTLPTTPNSDATLAGRETVNTGKMLQAPIFPYGGGTAQAIVVFYDNSYPGADGSVLHISGCYETQ